MIEQSGKVPAEFCQWLVSVTRFSDSFVSHTASLQVRWCGIHLAYDQTSISRKLLSFVGTRGWFTASFGGSEVKRKVLMTANEAKEVIWVKSPAAGRQRLVKRLWCHSKFSTPLRDSAPILSWHCCIIVVLPPHHCNYTTLLSLSVTGWRWFSPS